VRKGNRLKSYDPLQTARSQARGFNTAWLKNGESLTMAQRIGFTVVSLANIAGGLFVAREVIISSASASSLGLPDLFFLVCGAVVSLFFLFVGFLGVRNVLRFKPAR
jgi:hypothetical protein